MAKGEVPLLPTLPILSLREGGRRMGLQTVSILELSLTKGTVSGNLDSDIFWDKAQMANRVLDKTQFCVSVKTLVFIFS